MKGIQIEKNHRIRITKGTEGSSLGERERENSEVRDLNSGLNYLGMRSNNLWIDEKGFLSDI